MSAENDRQWGSRHAVRASAGSGKTYQLTGHYLRAFLNGAEPSAILATTFTRKAAGEILGRVLSRLSAACDSDDQLATLTSELALEGIDRQRARTHLVQLCRALHQVSISTIDGFFARLLNGYRYDLGLPANLRVVDGDSPEIAAIRAEAIRSLFEHSDREKLIALLDSLQQGNFNRGVASSLSDQLNKAHELFETTDSDVWLTGRPAGHLLTPEQLGAALRELERLAEALPQFATGIAGDIKRASAEQWLEFLGKGLAVKVKNGEANFSRKPIPEEVFLAYIPLVQHAKTLLLNRLADRTRALRELLEIYHEAYLTLRRRERVFQFRDVPMALAQLLPDQHTGEIAHRLDTNIDCLLLDEFQDTDPRQYAILKSFAQSIHDGHPEKGLLFCVGDLKQSIYGWRGAAPEIFRRFGDDFTDVRWTENNISYRSSQVVLDVVNRLFSSLQKNGILNEKNPAAACQWQPRFGEHSSKRKLPGYVEVVESSAPVDEGDESAEEGGAALVGDPHFDFTARRIQEIARHCPDATIGVLLRSNAAAGQLIFQLNRLGVPASAEGGGPIADDPAVAVILSALQFADHPSDSATRFHVINSPLGPVIRLVGEKPLPFAEAALRIRHQLAYEGYAAVVARWARQISPTCDERGAHRLTQLVELADTWGGGPGARASEFVTWLRAQAVEEPSPSNVRVMTIHKSKGLEFDVVVLPELHKRLNQNSGFGLVYRRDPATLRVTAVSIHPGKELRELDPELDAICTEYTQAEIEEALCLLYVAMTRPRHALHIIVPPRRVNANGSYGATPFTLASIVRHGLIEEDESVLPGMQAGGVIFSHGDSRWYQKVAKPAAPLPASVAAPARPVLNLSHLPSRNLKKVTPSTAGGAAGRSAAELLGLEESSARLRGSLMHAFLSRCAWHGDALADDAALMSLAGAVWPGASAVEHTACLADFKDLLQRPKLVQALSQPQLATGQEVALWRERPFALLAGDSFVSGTFDRVAIIIEGERAVSADLLDFKTGLETPGRYAAQMELYRQALCAMLALPPEKVKASIFFTDTGNLVEA